MVFTFECGSCQSTYRLDEAQITSTGVKITCPKCLNYFVLKLGGRPAEAPVVEHIVPDGPREISVPPPTANELTADQLLSDRDFESNPETKLTTEPETKVLATSGLLADTPIPVIPVESLQASPKRKEGTLDVAAIMRELPPLADPSELAPRSSFDQYLLPLSLIMLMVIGILFLNYREYIAIPGLESLRSSSLTPPRVISPTPVVEPSPSARGSKHGFPVIDPAYDGWNEDAAAAPPSPAFELPESNAPAPTEKNPGEHVN